MPKKQGKKPEPIIEDNVIDFSDETEDENDESAESDSEIYKMKQKKETGKQKNVEFEAEETQKKFVNALQAILSSGNNENPVMSQNSKYKREFEKSKKELHEKILRKIEKHRIFNKDFLRPVLEKDVIEKENKLKAIALEGVVALFKAVQKAKGQEKARDKGDSGYDALEDLHRTFLKGNVYPKQPKRVLDKKKESTAKKAKWSALDADAVVEEDQ